MFLVILVAGCVNPFAPSLNEGGEDDGLISDRSTVDGVFMNLQYAYTFKDSSIYGELLANDFSFTYRDYDRGVDVSWGRDEEMKVTDGLFQNLERLDLVWNRIISISADSTNVIRSFNLTFTFNSTSIEYADGRVNLSLRKDDENKWQIYHWIDESNY